MGKLSEIGSQRRDLGRSAKLSFKSGLAAAFAVILSAGSAYAIQSVPQPQDYTFTFNGTCDANDPCAAGTGHGFGTLKVTNYVLGDGFTNSNFLDFLYTSSVFTTPFEITKGTLGAF